MRANYETGVLPPDARAAAPWTAADLSVGTDLTAALRGAARAVLPWEAFLRRDRGEGLYVTDAALRRPDFDWQVALSRAGYEARRLRSGLLCLRPGEPWLVALSAAHPDPPDFLCATLKPFDAPPEPESLALFALGAKALEGGFDASLYEKRLRQRAAVCLRAGGGGGLYACGVVNALLSSGAPGRLPPR